MLTTLLRMWCNLDELQRQAWVEQQLTSSQPASAAARNQKIVSPCSLDCALHHCPVMQRPS